jgi:hypothetical protein
MLHDPPEYQPDEPLHSETWALVYLSGHAPCGGWTKEPGQPPVCVCGIVLEPQRAAA